MRESHGGFSSPDEGIVMLVVDYWTSILQYEELFFTNAFGAYREFNFVLDRISDGSFIIIFSLVIVVLFFSIH